MTVRFTQQGCKVETTYILQPNNTYWEKIVMSVSPDDPSALALEEPAGVSVAERAPKRQRVRATKFGFELIEDRR